MTETGIVALVGVIGTLVGAISGAWIARSGVIKQLRTQREYVLADTTRLTLVTLLEAARSWRYAIMLISTEMASAGSVDAANAVQERLLPVSAGLENPIIASRDELRRAVTEADLLVTDTELRAHILAFRDILIPRWWGEIVGVNLTSLENGTENADARLGRYFAFDAQITSRIDEVTRLAQRWAHSA